MPAQNQNFSAEAKKEFTPSQAGGGGVEKINKAIDELKPGILKKINLIIKSYKDLSNQNTSDTVKEKLQNLGIQIQEIKKIVENGTFKASDFDVETRIFLGLE